MTNDPPLHLSTLSICEKRPHAEASVTVPIWITQSSLDGMQTVLKVFEGMELAGRGRVSGSFELLMFYRTIVSAIRTAEMAHLRRDEPDEFVEITETA